MADGRKYRYDQDSDWSTYKIIIPTPQLFFVKQALQEIVAKGLYKITSMQYHDSTVEMWLDTTYNSKTLTDALKAIKSIQIRKQ